MPQPFTNAVMTKEGAKLLTRAQAGEINIEFTRIAIGSGLYEENEKTMPVLQEATGLRQEKNSYLLSGIEVFSEYSVKVTAMITNQNPLTQETLVSEGYFINEMGLFAKEKDGDESTEVLYSIAVTTGESGDFMPPFNGYSPAQIIQGYMATVSNAAEVNIKAELGAVALADDLKRAKEELDAKISGILDILNVPCIEEAFYNTFTYAAKEEQQQ